MNNIKTLIENLEVAVLSYDVYAIPETKDALKKARADLLFGIAEVWDEGADRAGRYGHEDGWDEDGNPYQDNPYRTDGGRWAKYKEEEID